MRLTTLYSNGLALDLAFQRHGDLAGLIWESVDRFSHPLCAYETGRDYRGTQLGFRWRTEGEVMPLDAINGPVLTIEGRDGSPPATAVAHRGTRGPSGAALVARRKGQGMNFLLPPAREVGPASGRGVGGFGLGEQAGCGGPFGHGEQVGQPAGRTKGVALWAGAVPRRRYPASALSMAPRSLSGVTVGAKRSMTRPSRPIRNLVKFHLIAWVPSTPLASPFNQA